MSLFFGTLLKCFKIVLQLREFKQNKKSRPVYNQKIYLNKITHLAIFFLHLHQTLVQETFRKWENAKHPCRKLSAVRNQKKHQYIIKNIKS